MYISIWYNVNVINTSTLLSFHFLPNPCYNNLCEWNKACFLGDHYWDYNRPISQIPECICAISHNATFCNRNVHMCAHFCYKMLHFWGSVWCIMGFVRWVYSAGTLLSLSGHCTSQIVPVRTAKWRECPIHIEHYRCFTNWGWEDPFSNSCSLIKMYVYLFKCYWSSFPRV